jgi:hypothetical protein
VIKLAEGPKGDFNLAFRSLIQICELLAANPRTWTSGGRQTLEELSRTLKALGESNSTRNELSTWIPGELHNLADRLALLPYVEPASLRTFLRPLAVLKAEELKTVLGGPATIKQHKLKREANHSWEATVLEELHKRGSPEVLATSLRAAVGRCTGDADLPGLVAIFEQLKFEYSCGTELDIQTQLRVVADNIASRFRKDYATVYRKVRAL